MWDYRHLQLVVLTTHLLNMKLCVSEGNPYRTAMKACFICVLCVWAVQWVFLGVKGYRGRKALRHALQPRPFIVRWQYVQCAVCMPVLKNFIHFYFFIVAVYVENKHDAVMYNW